MSMKTIEQIWKFPHPKSKVWAAITDSDQLSAWLMPNDFMPVIGHKFTFKTDPAPGFDGIVHCEVLTVKPEEEVSYSWKAGDLNTTLKMSLHENASHTELVLSHSGFGLRDIIPRVILGNGWKTLIRKKLPEYLQNAA